MKKINSILATCILLTILLSCTRMIRTKPHETWSYSPRQIKILFPDVAHNVSNKSSGNVTVGSGNSGPINVGAKDSLTVTALNLREPLNQRNITIETLGKFLFMVYNSNPTDTLIQKEYFKITKELIRRDYALRDSMVKANVQIAKAIIQSGDTALYNDLKTISGNLKAAMQINTIQNLR